MAPLLFMIDITETPAGYQVEFQYKPWIVDAIKRIPGSHFKQAEGKKFWHVPLSSSSALLNWAAKLGSQPKTQTAAEVGEIEPLPELTIDIPLKMALFPYQRNGVAYALDKKRVIVGDQPGLGKTGSSIAVAEGCGAKCILVICPATLKENWKREIENKWTNRKALILTDSCKNTWPTFYKVGYIKYFITNYESLKKYFVDSINTPIGKDGKPVPLRLNHIKFKDTIELFDFIIIDEIHKCKDGKTMQSKLTMGITKGKEYVLGLTGTPVVNKPIDLIPQLNIVGHLMNFGGYKGFVDRYCQGKNQASNLKELNYLLHKHCFYRREKKDVLKDLPDKMREIIKCKISNQKEYDKAENDFVIYLKENLGKTDHEISVSLRGEVMVMIGILKKIAARGKIIDVIQHVEEVVEAGEKIVVFAWHKEIIDELKKVLHGAVTVVGSDSMDSRQRSVDSFQNDPKVQVILCNIKSGGVGITLTASSRVVFIELPWHPADCEQCEDRTHRIGQKDSVQVSYFLGEGTIDEKIYEIIENKRAIVNQITGASDDVETSERSMIDQLIGIFSTPKN